MKPKPSVHRNQLGFNDSPADIRNALKALSPEAAQKQASLAQAGANALIKSRLFDLLPTVKASRKGKSPRRTPGVAFDLPHFLPLRNPILTTSLAVNPPVESSVVSILVTLINITAAPLSGTLRYSVDGAVPPTGGFVTYPVKNLASSATLNVVLLFIAPSAGLGHTLLVELVDNATKAAIVTSVLTFDTAALYSFTVNSAHVDEPRSPRNDTLTFTMQAYSVYPSETPSLTAQYLGNHGKGDNVAINATFNFILVPSADPALICFYALINDGSVRTGDDATKLSIYYSVIFDGFWGGINSGIAHSTPSGQSLEGGITLDPVYALVAWLIYGILTLDCNGIVALEPVIVTGAQLDVLTATGSPVEMEIIFEGSKSPVGCGRDSRYKLLHTIQRLSMP